MKRHCASIADYLESKENTMLIRLRVMRDMGRGFHAIYFTSRNQLKSDMLNGHVNEHFVALFQTATM